jgi:hypothetical protein
MYTNRISKYPATLIFAILLIISLAVAYSMATIGTMVAPIIVLGLIALLTTIFILRDYRTGLYILFIVGVFIFYIDRIADLNFPLGTLYDALVGLIFFALFVNNKQKKDWTLFKNPVTITFVIIIIYQLLQLFNPYSGAPIAWLVSLRGNISFLIYVVCFQMFSSFKEVKRFTKVWFILGTMVGLYALYQEYVGLTDFEWTWMYENPDRIHLYYIWGKMRKFSFLSDPSSFGIFMAASALACIPFMMGPFTVLKRVGFGLLMIMMLVAMSYSGTRTAMAMVIVGIVFFIIMTMHKRETLIGSVVMVFVSLVMLFGPFYGGTMTRLRSTLNPSEDASMAVRDVKRIRMQEYVKTHPIGGGLYTVGNNGQKYAPGHPLAGPWDPDSGYLLIALETGWIGLLIFQALFFFTMLRGIQAYFSMEDPVMKCYLLAYITSFLALSVAHFTQDAMFTKPINVLVFATYALVIRIPSFEKKLSPVELV